MVLSVRAPSPEFQPYGVIPVGEPTKKPDTRFGFLKKVM
jgi:hypothetical protein